MNTTLKRIVGAQFKKNLNGDILVFRYPTQAPRMFHTMWCSPLRIVVLENDSSDARVLYDKLVKPWRFVLLPAGELVLEMDPQTDYREALPEITQSSRQAPKISRDLPIGGVDSGISVTRMLFEMFAAALSDLRSVKSTCLDERGLLDPTKLAIQYEPWERGQILASAGFVLDFSPDGSWTLPRGVVPLSIDLVKCEREYADELLAASNGAAPSWRSDMKAVCLGCGDGGSWRPILQTEPELPLEISWRLLRPENNLPFCNRCAARFKVTRKANIRYELGSSFWGARFEALEKWYRAVLGDSEHLPHDWNKATHPLWPAAFGGDTWETGSGALQHIEPRWPINVYRAPDQIQFLKYIGVYDTVINYPVKS